MASEVSVIGRVEGSDARPVFIAAQLVIDGTTTPFAWGDCVVLATERGWITVKLDGNAFEPDRVRGPWSAVSSTPLGQLFASRAPGEHVHVELAGTLVVPGDVVAVSGVPIDDATASTPSVRATCAGRGADAATALAACDRRRAELAVAAQAQVPKPPPVPAATIPGRWLAWTLGVLAVGALGQAGASGAPIDSDWLRVGLLLVVATVLAWSTRYDMPHAFELAAELRGSTRHGWLLYALLLPIGFVELAYHERHPGGLGGRTGSVLMTCAVPVLAIAWYAIENRRALRWLKLVAQAPPATSPPVDGAWCRWVGTVRGAPGAKAIDIAARRGTRSSGGSKPTYYTVLRFEITRELTFDIDAGGTVLRVKSEHAIVAGVPRWVPREQRARDMFTDMMKGTGGLTEWLWNRAQREDPTAALVIATGDPVTVVGRVHQQWLAASGPESLFVVRGSPVEARRAVAAPMIAHAVFVAAVALLFAIA